MAEEATQEAPDQDPGELDVVPQGDAGTGNPGPDSEVDWRQKFEAQQKVNRDLERKLKGEAGSLNTQLQELQTKLANQETEYQDAAARALRYEVAAETGLPLNAAARLQGATKEELVSDAEELAKMLSRTTGSADVGVRTDPPAKVTQNDLIRTALRRS